MCPYKIKEEVVGDRHTQKEKTYTEDKDKVQREARIGIM
jgi:hypothetical protein